MICQEIENKVVSIIEKYHVKTIGIFGSYASGVQRPVSLMRMRNRIHHG
ncbi:MAG: hypothetical protein HYV59_15310 [Planctomycetes bacterium]|nr:hypothetical protein [Planctomycetota bacterium]